MSMLVKIEEADGVITLRIAGNTTRHHSSSAGQGRIMTDLHTRLRSAIEERLTLAQAVHRSGERISLDWPRTPTKDALIAFIDSAPDFVIRACRADLARLERHRPIPLPQPMWLGPPVICSYEWANEEAGRLVAWADCPEVRSLAEVWLP